MPERDPQELLAAYRSGLGPSRAVEDRMLASLRSHVVAVPDPSAAGAAGGAGAASGSVGATVTAKLAAAALAASVTVAAVTVAVIKREAPAVEAATVVRVEPAEVGSDPPELVLPPPVVPPAATEVTAPEAPEVESAAVATQPRSAARRRVQPDLEREPAPSLADEAKLLRGVDLALRRNDLEGAREQLEVYRESFTSGSLHTQAEELALLLACADGSPGATQRARDHLSAHPNTRARNRIEETCDAQ